MTLQVRRYQKAFPERSAVTSKLLWSVSPRHPLTCPDHLSPPKKVSFVSLRTDGAISYLKRMVGKRKTVHVYKTLSDLEKEPNKRYYYHFQFAPKHGSCLVVSTAEWMGRQELLAAGPSGWLSQLSTQLLIWALVTISGL